MVLAPKQTYGSMEQNREPRSKPIHIQPINLQQRKQEYTMGKRQSLQQVVLGELDSHRKINEIRTHLHTTHKNKLRRVKDLNIRYATMKLIKESIGKIFSDIKCTNAF